jgi:uncharacterized membrane protein
MGILLVVAGILRPTKGAGIPTRRQAFSGGLWGLAAFGASILLFGPYTSSFFLAQRGLGRATMFSEILEFFGVWGILLVVALVGLWPRLAEDSEAARRRRGLGLAIAAGISLLAGLALERPVMPIVVFFGLLAAFAAWRAWRAAPPDPDAAYAAFLVLLALSMIGGCELVYFRDTYGTDLQRMNTIFKFYHQAWPLLAVGGVVFAGRAWDASGRRRPAPRAVLALCTLAAALWPVNVAVSRLRQRDAPFSLDAHGPLVRRNKGDAAVIDWLAKNAPIGSVVLEASGDPYSEYARISTHTGIPTVLGWANHEGLWRSRVGAEDPEVAARLARIKLFYTTPDPRVAWEALRQYGVTHVILGDMERKTYGTNPAIAGFPFLDPIFASEGTVVYAVSRPK